ncbi:MAG: hypothetical protein ABI782_11425 [Anaerolineaceae bacterium]
MDRTAQVVASTFTTYLHQSGGRRLTYRTVTGYLAFSQYSWRLDPARQIPGSGLRPVRRHQRGRHARRVKTKGRPT